MGRHYQTYHSDHQPIGATEWHNFYVYVLCTPVCTQHTYVQHMYVHILCTQAYTVPLN